MNNNDRVEVLARWMHETYLTFPGSSKVTKQMDWDELKEISRDKYRHVARALLTNPPMTFREGAGDDGETVTVVRIAE